MQGVPHEKKHTCRLVFLKFLACLQSHIPYYYVITQYSLTEINGDDRLVMFAAVCHHVFLITVLLHITFWQRSMKLKGWEGF